MRMMTRKPAKTVVLTSLLVALVYVGSTLAADKGPITWNTQTLKLIESGNAENGKALAEKCAKCHGEKGISEDNDTPNIAGQAASYTFKQLLDYKSKLRKERSMNKAVRKLKVQDLADLAAYYHGLPKEESLSGGKNPPAIAVNDDKKRLLIACNTCHGPNGDGYGYESPMLSGQKIGYFMTTMQEFKENDRNNDIDGRMRFIAQQLTEQELNALANYYSAKPIAE